MKPWNMSRGDLKKTINENHVGFKKLEKELKSNGAEDPAALAAWIGRKKYGKKRFQAMANEDISQIDEISLGKADNYITRTKQDAENAAGEYYAAKFAGDENRMASAQKRLEKRRFGRRTVLDKLANRAKVNVSESVANDLLSAMQTVHASNFCFYWKAHTAHWNVEGPDFPAFHEFFGDLYEDVYGAVDTIAEHIRTLDSYPDDELEVLIKKSIVTGLPSSNRGTVLALDLEENNQKLINCFKDAQKLAEQYGYVGLSNFLQDRIDIHEKHGWMLRSIGVK